jgi:hypothetical protein
VVLSKSPRGRVWVHTVGPGMSLPFPAALYTLLARDESRFPVLVLVWLRVFGRVYLLLPVRTKMWVVRKLV